MGAWESGSEGVVCANVLCVTDATCPDPDSFLHTQSQGTSGRPIPCIARIGKSAKPAPVKEDVCSDTFYNPLPHPPTPSG